MVRSTVARSAASLFECRAELPAFDRRLDEEDAAPLADRGKFPFVFSVR